MATLHELITKVIPLKGILRTPSYWMRKVFISIADAVEAVRAELDGKVEAVHTELDSKVEAVSTQLNSTSDKLVLKDELLTKAILYAKTGQPFFILDKGTKMKIDGNVIQAEPYTVYKAKSLLFSRNETSIDFLISLNIPEISFNGCTSLTAIDLSNFDTSTIKTMRGMFYGCKSLTSLDVSSFNTSAVTNMTNMFYGCTSLTSLNLSNFDTSAVTDMPAMFQGCSSLTSLDLSSFDISKVIYKNSMFKDCTALKTIKCKQAFKDWCVANESTIKLTVANITWEIVQ